MSSINPHLSSQNIAIPEQDWIQKKSFLNGKKVIFDLPIEVMERIDSFLPLKEVIPVRAVNLRWKFVTKDRFLEASQAVPLYILEKELKQLIVSLIKANFLSLAMKKLLLLLMEDTRVSDSATSEGAKMAYRTLRDWFFEILSPLSVQDFEQLQIFLKKSQQIKGSQLLHFARLVQLVKNPLDTLEVKKQIMDHYLIKNSLNLEEFLYFLHDLTFKQAVELMHPISFRKFFHVLATCNEVRTIKRITDCMLRILDYSPKADYSIISFIIQICLDKRVLDQVLASISERSGSYGYFIDYSDAIIRAKTGNVVRAIASGNKISASKLRNNLWVHMTRCFLERIDFKSALKIIDEASDRNTKNRIYQEIVEKYIERGDINNAAKVADKLSEGLIKNDVYLKIAEYYFYEDDFEKVLKAASKVSDSYETNSVYKLTALKYLEKEELEKAAEIISKVTDHREKNDVYLEIAIKYLENDDLDHTMKIMILLFKGLIGNSQKRTILELCVKKFDFDFISKKIQKASKDITNPIFNNELHIGLSMIYQQKKDIDNYLKAIYALKTPTILARLISKISFLIFSKKPDDSEIFFLGEELRKKKIEILQVHSARLLAQNRLKKVFEVDNQLYDEKYGKVLGSICRLWTGMQWLFRRFHYRPIQI